jgi:hypothetical protein
MLRVHGDELEHAGSGSRPSKLVNFHVLKLITLCRYRIARVAALTTWLADPPGVAAPIAYISVIIWLARFMNKPCNEISRGSPSAR